MAESVGIKITRKPKTMYYLDGAGNMWERNIKTGGKSKVSHSLLPLNRLSGYLYYVDGSGRVMRARMKHGKRR